MRSDPIEATKKAKRERMQPVETTSNLCWLPVATRLPTCTAASGIILVANMAVQKSTTPESALKVLPLFHAAMLVYTASIIFSYFL